MIQYLIQKRDKGKESYFCPDILGPTKQTNKTICVIKYICCFSSEIMTIRFKPERVFCDMIVYEKGLKKKMTAVII